MRVYGAAAAAAVWLGAVPWTIARAAIGRAAPGELQERLGRARRPAHSGAPILIHGVSAGEMTSARALIEALVQREPTVRILLTTGTGDGRTIAERIRDEFPQVAGCTFLPWDRPAVIRRWLTRFRPRAVAVVETELWPGLFAACRVLSVPLFVVSGRLYPRDVSRYQRMGRWWSDVMTLPTRVFAQDSDEAEAFVAIGTPRHLVEVGGNLKFDAAHPSPAVRTNSRLTVVAGSTHAPEEVWILDAVSQLRHAGIP